MVAGLAELVGASAAVGAFLVGLTLTGPVAARARAVLTPLRDLFAAAFFLAIGLGIDAGAIPPVLPAALATRDHHRRHQAAHRRVRRLPRQGGMARASAPAPR